MRRQSLQTQHLWNSTLEISQINLVEICQTKHAYFKPLLCKHAHYKCKCSHQPYTCCTNQKLCMCCATQHCTCFKHINVASTKALQVQAKFAKCEKKTCFQLAHAMFCKFCKHRVCNCAFVLCIRHEFTHLQIKLTRLRTKLTSLLNRDCTFANTTWKCEEHIVSMLATKSANVQNNKLEHSKRKHC